MKRLEKITVVLLAVMMAVSLANLVFAETETHDGVKITLSSDKKEYQEGETITAELTVTNTNEFDLTDVSLKHLVPDGYKLAENSSASKELDVLGAGQSVSLTVKYAAEKAAETTPPKTEDRGHIIFWVILFAAACAGMAVLIFRRKNKGTPLLLLILCLGIVGTMTVGISAASENTNETKSVEISSPIKVSGKDTAIKATVGYKLSDEKADEGDVLELSDYYVDVTGSDKNPGTKDAPFRTLEKARDTVRKYNGNMANDIVIHIGSGVFELEDTFELTDKDSGSNGHRVIYEGQGKDKTVISGGTEVTGWTLYDADKNIYCAKVEDGLNFRQLYIDGTKAVRARSGKTGQYDKRILDAERIKDGKVLPELLLGDSADAKAQADDGTIFISKNDGTFSSEWGNLNDVELHIFSAWTVNILRVKSAELDGSRYSIKVADEEAELIFNRQHPNIDGYSHMSTRNFVYYVENAYELIDEENEWYLDRETNTAYLKAPVGVDPNKKQITVPKLETVINVNGTLDKPVENVTFRNLSVQYSSWLKPSEEGFVDGQSMQYITRTVFAKNDAGVGRPSAGILVTGAKKVEFDNNKIANMGATGIDFFWGTDHCVISNNEIENISGNGVSVGKFAENSEVDYHVPYNPADKREICTGDMIVNNKITNVGTDYESAVAVAAGYPKNILIANNTISYSPYTGITVGFGWTKSPNAMSGNRIIRNEIHHVTTMLCDAGGIYTLSEQPGSKMLQNYIHDIVLPKWADYGTFGIYLDEGTGGYAVNENILENAYTINQHATGENLVYGNYLNPSGTVVSDRADEIKKLAGVQEKIDIEELLALTEASEQQGNETERLTEDNFDGYGAGAFASDKWTVGDGQDSLVKIVEGADGNKYVEIVSHGSNTTLYSTYSFGANVTTFDFMFPKNLTQYEGIYNVIRKSSITYTSNITPAYWTSVRLETKGDSETGISKEIKSETWYTCKTMVNGRTMYMKAWERGAAEPEEWDVIRDMNDDVKSDCMLGIEFYAFSDASVYIDNVAIDVIKEK